MYKCEVTNKFSKPGELLNRIVVETRERIYFKEVLNEETRRMETVEVGRGWEIVKEIRATDEGVKIWNANQILTTS